MYISDSSTGITSMFPLMALEPERFQSESCFEISGSVFMRASIYMGP
ncbi:MAG: hypothetical protein GXY14_00055 [Spirochaetes bacterium]|nr:hypothetical protein [Spirochaetota bacterium]